MSTSAFIGDLVDIDREILPFELAPELVCDAATANERRPIRSWLRQELGHLLGVTETGTGWAEMYEYGETGGEFAPLPAEMHRYFVFRASGNGTASLASVERIGRLCEPELVPAFTMFAIGKGQSASLVPTRVRFHTHFSGPGYYTRAPASKPAAVSSVGQQELDRLRDLIGCVDALGTTRSRITRALSLFVQCDDVVRFSGMWTLAHFAVIEALLAHQPKGGDRLDSLSRQLRLSIPLLLRRSPALGDFDRPFGLDAPVEIVVKRLYDLRSTIAHGSWEVGEGFPDNLRLFENYETACSTLRSMTKVLLSQALREPQLVLDLAGSTR